MHANIDMHSIVRLVSVAVGTKALLAFYPAGAGWENYRAVSPPILKMLPQMYADYISLPFIERSSAY
jgi:hypothetical protein